jgi:predicted DNA-binding transcriptional regulator YafY
VPAPDRLERLTNLVLVLLNASRPLTLDAIAAQVPGYPQDHTSRRQAFERDKRVLRDEGIPVATEPVDGHEQFGYRIDPDALYLPELGLTPAEQAALQLAVAGVHLGDPSGRDALLKLGATGIVDARPVATVDSSPALASLYHALLSAATVTFTYHGGDRTVAPAGLAFRGGRWYLVGWDEGRGAVRTFRVDRIGSAIAVGAAGAGAPPASASDALTRLLGDEPWPAGDDEMPSVAVAVDAHAARHVEAELGADAVVERRAAGEIVVRLGAPSPFAWRAWVLGQAEHATVLEPPAARAEIVEWLDAMVQADTRSPTGGVAAGELPPWDPGGDAPPARGDATPAPGDGRPTVRRLDAPARLRRLLAIVGWLARVGRAPIAEIAERFGIEPADLVHELELAACCGLPPYSPDVLMEIVVSDDAIETFLPADLGRPRRLTPAEGFALATAARTILAVPGADQDGALAAGLSKLEAVLGDPGAVRIRIDDPPHLRTVRDAQASRTRLAVEYHSASADETTARVIQPLEVISLDGHWYVDAYCERAEAVRRFRVDRILTASDAGGGAFPARRGPDGPAMPDRDAAFVPGPGAAVVRLALGPGARWVADSVPVVRVGDAAPAAPDGTGPDLQIELAVAGRAWLERLLLQAGPDAAVVGPPEFRGTGAAAARRVLENYRS